MELSEINFRDPYVLPDKDMYYMYGTTVFMGKADNFVCYKSADLKSWEGPVEIFHRPESFWADQCYWAPECYAYDGRYFFLTTMGSENRKKGIQIMTCDSPDGRYTPVGSGPVTPEEWTCIDGTLYWENNTPYLIFSHSFEDGEESAICGMPLNEKLTGQAGAVFKMFEARQAPWARPCPWSKEEFGIDGEIYLADGPCLYRTARGSLLMIWSSWGEHGYTVGIARSTDGTLHGTWEQQAEPLFKEGGGHGMIFNDREGKTYYILHTPNEPSMERPKLYELLEKDDTVVLK